MWFGVIGEFVKLSLLMYLVVVVVLLWVCRDGVLRVKYRCWLRIVVVSSVMMVMKDLVIML